MAEQRDHLVLVGMMGSGKTVVGRACAGVLGRDFVDTDTLVESVAGRSVAEIFAGEGEEGFRVREAEAIEQACTSGEVSVIACGGGAVLDAVTRERLRTSGFVVWLDAPPTVLADRVGDGSGRPLLEGSSTRDALEAIAAERRPLYESVSHARVDASRKVSEVVDDVLAAFPVTAGRPRGDGS